MSKFGPFGGEYLPRMILNDKQAILLSRTKRVYNQVVKNFYDPNNHHPTRIQYILCTSKSEMQQINSDKKAKKSSHIQFTNQSVRTDVTWLT